MKKGKIEIHHIITKVVAEDVNEYMVVVPEIVLSTSEVTIDDIQVGYPGILLSEDQEKLRQLIWKIRHFLIGKGNAPPLAARGAVCDIDVYGANGSHSEYDQSCLNFVRSWLISLKDCYRQKLFHLRHHHGLRRSS